MINKPLITFHLKGRLGEDYGKEYRFAVSSVAEGLRAMCCQFKGDDTVPAFTNALMKGSYQVFRDRKETATEELQLNLGTTKNVYIVPVIEGEGSRGGAGKIILGLVLVAATIITAGGASPALLGATIGSTSITFGQVAAVGLLIAASGAAQLLSPTPTAVDSRTRERPEERASFLINSLTNTTEEGAPVPIVHGTRVLVGSHVVSAGLDVESIPLDEIIVVEDDFTSVHAMTQGIDVQTDPPDPEDVEFRGYNNLDPDAPNPFDESTTSRPAIIGSFSPELFRNIDVRSVLEVHFDDPPPVLAQHTLRVTLLGGERPSRTMFNSVTIALADSPFTVLFVKTTDEPSLLYTFGVWSWTIGASFILDGTSDLTVTFGYGEE